MQIFGSGRRLKRLAIGLVVLLALLLIANGIFAWRAESQLRSRLAAIRATGDPASIAELKPAPIPDEQNAAAIIDRIRPRLDEFHKSYARFYDSPLGKAYEETTNRGEVATKEQIEAIRDILSQFADVEHAIDEAAACKRYASRRNFSLNHTAFIEQTLENVKAPRTAARFLEWRNEVLMNEGNYPDAIRNGIRMLRLARLQANEPTLVDYLVAIAIRAIADDQLYDALAAGSVPTDLHAALDAEIARFDDPQQLVEALKKERAVGAVWIDAQFSVPDAVPARAFGWPLKSYQVGVLDEMNDVLQLAGRPWYEVQKVLGAAEVPGQRTGHGVMADLLLPAIRAAFEANARSIAFSRALRIDNALRAFADKNGREVKGLEELGLLQDETIDPFSGEPLKLKHTDEGWIVYSVMTNGVDDGGDFKDLKDYGVAPRKWRRGQ